MLISNYFDKFVPAKKVRKLLPLPFSFFVSRSRLRREFASRRQSAWIASRRESPATGFTALLSFQISQHASRRGRTRTMVHECVRRVRTMVQLRMYRRLLLPRYNPSRHRPRNSSFSPVRAAKTSRPPPPLLRLVENFRCFPCCARRCSRKSRITEAFYVKSAGHFIPGIGVPCDDFTLSFGRLENG